jgi:hypothetical protein
VRYERAKLKTKCKELFLTVEDNQNARCHVVYMQLCRVDLDCFVVMMNYHSDDDFSYSEPSSHWGKFRKLMIFFSLRSLVTILQPTKIFQMNGVQPKLTPIILELMRKLSDSGMCFMSSALQGKLACELSS